MTVKEIAKHTGYSTDAIYKFIRDGEIAATHIKTKYGIKINVDPAYIPVLREHKASAVIGRPAMVKVEKKSKDATLRNAIIDLVEYNKKHNSNLSYGQATAMGII